jgi:predicted nuclease of restriction endonuclease-like (RecB) superfamily
VELPAAYAALLAEAKSAIVGARQRALLAVNAEMLQLYWRLGSLMAEQRRAEGWGTKISARLSADLRAAFPDMKGLSPRNLRYMRTFAEAWPADSIGQRTVAQLPWGHNIELLDRLDTAEERLCTPAGRSSTAGRGRCWPIRSCPGCTCERAGPRRTSSGCCRHRSRS